MRGLIQSASRGARSPVISRDLVWKASLALVPLLLFSPLTWPRVNTASALDTQEYVEIAEGRYGAWYADALKRAVAKPQPPGREVPRVPPFCFVNQRFWHSTANPLSVSQRPVQANTCMFCHNDGTKRGGHVDDSSRQKRWPQTTESINPWVSSFDPAWLNEVVPPREVPPDLADYLRVDNYRASLRLSGVSTYSPLADYTALGRGDGDLKYFPDLDPQTVDAKGWANNGWRAFKATPFPGFIPADTGRWHTAWVRLPRTFRLDSQGEGSREVYAKNLDLLEQVIKGEVKSGRYVGRASDTRIIPHRYPQGTELLLLLSYVDPQKGKATRTKEIRYSVKSVPEAEIVHTHTGDNPGGLPDPDPEYRHSLEGKEGRAQAVKYGIIYNHAGWDLIDFLEQDTRRGLFRPATRLEAQFCIGCHSRNIGTVRDSHWLLQRKLPGKEGWRVQDYRQMKDYLGSMGNGDLFDFYTINTTGGGRILPYADEEHVDLLPASERVDVLNKRYYQIVEAQAFIAGRDPVVDALPLVFEREVNVPGEPLRIEGADFQVHRNHDPALDFSDWERRATAEAKKTRIEKGQFTVHGGHIMLMVENKMAMKVPMARTQSKQVGNMKITVTFPAVPVKIFELSPFEILVSDAKTGEPIPGVQIRSDLEMRMKKMIIEGRFPLSPSGEPGRFVGEADISAHPMLGVWMLILHVSTADTHHAIKAEFPFEIAP